MAIAIRISWSVTFKNTINCKNRGLQFCKKAERPNRSDTASAKCHTACTSLSQPVLSNWTVVVASVPISLNTCTGTCFSQLWSFHATASNTAAISVCIHYSWAQRSRLLCTLREVCSMLPCANQPSGSLDGWEAAGRLVSSLLVCLNYPFSPSKSIWFKAERKYKLRIEEFCTWRNAASNVFAQQLLLFITFKHMHVASVFTAVAQLSCCIWMIRYLAVRQVQLILLGS